MRCQTLISKISIGVAMLFVDSGAGLSAEETGSSPYHLVGRVTVEGTGEPVIGAKVQVLVGKSGHVYQSVYGETQADGRYFVAVPVGQARVWSLECPSGYRLAQSHTPSNITTSEQQPIVTRNFQVTRGVAWKVRLVDQDQNASVDDAYVSATKTDGTGFTFARSDAEGSAVLTMPPAGGSFQIRFVELKAHIATPKPATLDFEEGFDPSRVDRLTRDEKTGRFQCTDIDGKTATLDGPTASITDGALELTLAGRNLLDKSAATVSGTVTDEKGQPIAKTHIAVALNQKSGGGYLTQHHAVSAENGTFTVEAIPAAETATGTTQYSLVVTKKGYAGIDTKPVDFVAGPNTADPIRMQRGHTLGLLVVDPDGEPVNGAWVEPINSYADRRQFAKTDARGRCRVHDLSKGVTTLLVTYGDLLAQPQLVVDSTDDVRTVRLQSLHTAQRARREAPQPLKAGQKAPEWKVVGWTDGESRRLSNFRGKVVAIDFWGVWCKPCLHAMTALNQLHEQYKDRDVVFLGIHTAGTEISEIRRLLELQECEFPSALDAVKPDSMGATVQRYGVSGFPTFLIVDRHGKVAFNSSDVSDPQQFMERLKDAATSLKFPWPIDKDATEQQTADRVSQVQVHIFSQEIEAALDDR